MDPWNLDLRERARSVPGPSSSPPSPPPKRSERVCERQAHARSSRDWDGMARIGIGVGEFIERQDTIADFIPSRI